MPAPRPVLIAVAVLGLAGYLAVAIHLGSEHLALGLSALGLRGVCAVLGLSLLNYALRFWRWRGYIHQLGHDIPLARHCLYYFAGFAFTVSPGKAGEAVRAVYLTRHQVPVMKVFAALFVERALDLLAICLLAIVCAGSISGYRSAALALGAVVLGLGWMLGRPGLTLILARRAEVSGPRLRSLLGSLSAALQASQQLLQPARLYPALLLGMLAWSAEGYGLCLLAQAFGVHLDLQSGIAIYAIGVLGGAMSFFMPGGLGGVEAAMTGLLIKVAGATLGLAGAITLLCRFATLWFAVVLGLVALVLLELRPPAPLSRSQITSEPTS